MVKTSVRISVILLMIMVILLFFPSSMPKEERITTISNFSGQQSNIASGGQGINFKSQWLRFELKGNFSSANWTIFKHNVVRNQTFVKINTSVYSTPVILKLETGYYTIKIEAIILDGSITLRTKQFGLPENYIVSSLLSGLSLTGIVLFHLIYYFYLKKEK